METLFTLSCIGKYQQIFGAYFQEVEDKIVKMNGYSLMRKIVRNDAIKSDPPEVYNWRAFALAAAVHSWSNGE